MGLKKNTTCSLFIKGIHMGYLSHTLFNLKDEHKSYKRWYVCLGENKGCTNLFSLIK
jgi:hypothetical protein